ncbi:MAG: response regulator [Candidatus Dormiibacterota bacterium]
MANTAFTILLVEDDQVVAEMYRLALVASGRSVIVGRDGEQGLALAADEDPDFIVLDLRLPKLDGLEVLSHLRNNAKTRDIPVIILSNVGDPRMLERVSRSGVVEFMIKAHTTPAQLSLRIGEHERRARQPVD